MVAITAHMDAWGRGGDWSGPPWPIVVLIPLLILALVGFAAIALGRLQRHPSATGIVAERYAQGEIDETEYRRRVAELRGRGDRRREKGNDS